MAYEYGDDSNATFGNNTFVGSFAIGDVAGTLYGNGKGGNDLLIGVNSPQFFNSLRGDAISMTDFALGGNDTLIAGDNTTNYLRGDCDDMYRFAVGGNDSLVGGTNSTNYLFGDGDNLFGNSRGGDDTIIGGANAINFEYGDARSLFESAASGRDLLIGGDYSINLLLGDSWAAFSSVHFGNDTITGGNHSTNFIIGDSRETDYSCVGGDDKLIGGTNSDNLIYGDTAAARRSEHLGNDSLYGGDGATNTMYGDAFAMVYNSVAGNDLLVAGNGGINRMVGDAETVTRDIFSEGGGILLGNDTLVSGASNDDMWGDYVTKIDNGPVTRGSDVFVFSEHGGVDTVHDFVHGEDKIDLSAILLTSAHLNSHMLAHIPPQALKNILSNPQNTSGFAYLDSNADGILNGSDSFVRVTNGTLTLDIGAANRAAAGVDVIALSNVDFLIAGDFIL